jgi:hypothetical protein
MAAFPIQPSDISYSQIYSPSPIEPTHSLSVSLPPDAMVLVVSLLLALGVIWYKKHRIHHHRIERQRAMLERLWQLSSTKQ